MFSRSCAVCGKEIRGFDICKDCFKEYGNGGRDSYPEWLKELIRIQSSFDRSKANQEEYLEEVRN